MIPEVAVVRCDANTAKAYGEIKRDLLAKGRPLPENHICIAAIAIQHALPLVSRDAHFREIANLNLQVL